MYIDMTENLRRCDKVRTKLSEVCGREVVYLVEREAKEERFRDRQGREPRRNSPPPATVCMGIFRSHI